MAIKIQNIGIYAVMFETSDSLAYPGILKCFYTKDEAEQYLYMWANKVIIDGGEVISRGNEDYRVVVNDWQGRRITLWLQSTRLVTLDRLKRNKELPI